MISQQILFVVISIIFQSSICVYGISCPTKACIRYPSITCDYYEDVDAPYCLVVVDKTGQALVQGGIRQDLDCSSACKLNQNNNSRYFRCYSTVNALNSSPSVEKVFEKSDNFDIDCTVNAAIPFKAAGGTIFMLGFIIIASLLGNLDWH
jgi:hypothetical protein